MKQYNTQNGTMTPKLVVAAGAQAAAQGLVRSALLTKLLPFAGAVSLLVGLFGLKRGTETRPAAGNAHAATVSRSAVPKAARRAACRRPGMTLNPEVAS